jgi:hypothetical protein
LANYRLKATNGCLIGSRIPLSLSKESSKEHQLTYTE